MISEQQQLNDMYDRVLQVFPDEVWSQLAPQQQTLAESAMARVREREGDAALTLNRLEGIKELVTQHLWSPALTAASKMLATLGDGDIRNLGLYPVEVQRLRDELAGAQFSCQAAVHAGRSSIGGD